MMKENIAKAINHQIKLEEEASRLYLAMASWSDANGFPGAAAFLYEHSDEEREHQLKLMKYLNERGNHALCSALEVPGNDYKDLTDIFEQIMEHEQMITKSINDIYDLAFKEKDFNTCQFLQWYIMEQDEEEALFGGILDKLNLICKTKGSLYHFDNYLAGEATAAATAEEE